MMSSVAMLGWLASGPDPDGGLLGFRKLSESVGGSHWYLHMLRDSSAAGERLAHVLSSSRYIADMLEHTPQAAAWMDRDQDLMPLDLATIQTEMAALLRCLLRYLAVLDACLSRQGRT